MVEKALVYGAGALVATEATGVTNITGSSNEESSRGGSRGSGIPQGLLNSLGNGGTTIIDRGSQSANGMGAALAAAFSNMKAGNQGVNPAVVNSLMNQQKQFMETVKETTQETTETTEETTTTVTDTVANPFQYLFGGGGNGGNGGSGGSGGSTGSGRDFTSRGNNLDLQDYHNTGMIGNAAAMIGEGGKAAGDTVNAVVNTATGGANFAGNFTKENPYVTAGTGIGAVSPDPVTTASGFLAGSAVEVTADTVTGGTPLGVQSPVNVTKKNWWQGPDPLNLGGNKKNKGNNTGNAKKKDKKKKKKENLTKAMAEMRNIPSP